MKNAILAGAIAGVVMGILMPIIGFISGEIGLIEPPGGKEIWGTPMYMLLGLAHISLGLIWGSIFGAVYAFLYSLIPGKGALKGLYFGLSIWVIKDVAAGSYLALTMMEVNSAIILIVVGFFMWIVYGLVLGYLYRKPTK